jgi:hypothetical protein
VSEANAASCIRACYEDARCAAWTYVKPGIQAPGAQCWLKNTVPQAVSDDCCVSGKAPAVDTSQLTSTLFRIRLRSSYDITVVGGAGVFFVDVEQYNDGNWGAQRTTGFLGVGGGVSLKAGVSGPGDWQEFSVAIPARTADFKGTVGGVVIYPGAAVVVGVSGGLTLVFDRAEERVTVWVPGGNHGFGITVVTFLGGYWF